MPPATAANALSTRERAPLKPLWIALGTVAVWAASATLIDRDPAAPNSAAYVWYGLLSLASLISMCVCYVLAVRTGRRPAALGVRGGMFTAAPGRAIAYLAAAQVTAVALVTDNLVRHWHGHPVARGLGVVGLALVLASAVGFCAALLGGRPCLALTPDAVVLRDILGTIAVPWTAMDARQPGPTEDPRTVALARPDLVERRGLLLGRNRGLGGQRLEPFQAQPVFLARVLRYYAAHPQRRQEIGSAAGYDQLLAALDVTPGPPSDGGRGEPPT